EEVLGRTNGGRGAWSGGHRQRRSIRTIRRIAAYRGILRILRIVRRPSGAAGWVGRFTSKLPCGKFAMGGADETWRRRGVVEEELQAEEPPRSEVLVLGEIVNVERGRGGAAGTERKCGLVRFPGSQR